MKTKQRLIVIVFTLVFITVTFFFVKAKNNRIMSEEERRSLSPEEVLREFFSSWADKNQHDMELFLEQRNHGILWNLRNQKSLQLITLENTTNNQVESDLNSGDGNMIKEAAALGYQIETFVATFEQTFYCERDSNWSDGERTEMYILIKKTESSPWEVYAYGFG